MSRWSYAPEQQVVVVDVFGIVVRLMHARPPLDLPPEYPVQRILSFGKAIDIAGDGLSADVRVQIVDASVWLRFDFEVPESDPPMQTDATVRNWRHVGRRHIFDVQISTAVPE